MNHAQKDKQSPSGKYTLRVTTIETKPGCWNYTRGTVSAEGGREVAVVDRNYSSFPFLFVEGHPNGHDYLVCGADYQGQTVIELDTGKRLDFVPAAAKGGAGFCWTNYRFDVASRLLVVSGCIWACPFEFRFYDFTDPMSGWPELDTGDVGIWSDSKEPTIETDGTIRCYDTAPANDDEDEDAETNPAVEKAIKTFRRVGNKLVLVSEWVSEAEQAARGEHEAGRIRHEKWLADFKASDPLFLVYRDLVQHPALLPEAHESSGITYPGWCPHFTGEETRWCRRIVKSAKDSKGHTIDLEWGVKTGPVKVTAFFDGKLVGDTYFEHSVEGMHAAFAFAVGLLSTAVAA